MNFAERGKICVAPLHENLAAISKAASKLFLKISKTTMCTQVAD